MKKIELDCEWILNNLSHGDTTSEDNNIQIWFRSKSYTEFLFVKLALDTMSVKYNEDEFVREIEKKHYTKEKYTLRLEFDIDAIKVDCPNYYKKHIKMVRSNKTKAQTRKDKLSSLKDDVIL